MLYKVISWTILILAIGSGGYLFTKNKLGNESSTVPHTENVTQGNDRIHSAISESLSISLKQLSNKDFKAENNNFNKARVARISAHQEIPSPPQRNMNTIIVDNNDAFLKEIQKLKAGDRLLVRNGTYQAPEGNEIVITAQGTVDNWIVVAAYPGHKPKIKGTSWGAVRLVGAAYVEIRGFEVQGADPNQNPSGGGIGATNRSHHIRLIKNIVRDTPGGGVGAIHSDYIHFEGNTIYNVAWGWLPSDPNHSYATSAISLYQLTDADQHEPGIRNIVRGNIVFNAYNTKPFLHGNGITDGNCFILDDTRHTQEWGMAVKAGFTAPYTGTTLVENNLCVDNGGRGIHAFKSDNLIARNNTLYKNGKTPGLDGELSTNRSGNIRFYNNILYAYPGSKAIVNRDSNDVEIENNLLFGSNRTDEGVGTLIKGNPLFVNASTNLNIADFSLKSGSPAIGAGSSEDCAETYIDGTPRYEPCDLGAFPAIN